MLKQVVFTGPRTLDIVDLPEPTLGPGQVRIRTLFSGISRGTEMAVYRGQAPFYQKQFDRATRLFLSGAPEWEYPLAYGYENVGEVVELGPDVANLKLGDIVFSYAPHQTQVVLDEGDAYRLPDGIAPEEGVLVALLGVAYNAILDAQILLDETVAIFGMGVVGLLLVQLARLSGAGQVVGIDLLEARLAQARRVGASNVLNPAETADVALAVRRLTANRGADVAIECTGSSKALNEAIRTVGLQGRVIAVSFITGEARGIYLGEEFHHNRVRIISSQAVGVNPELTPRWDPQRKLDSALKLLPRLDLKGLITHRIPFAQAAQAYQEVDENPEESIQVVLAYS